MGDYVVFAGVPGAERSQAPNDAETPELVRRYEQTKRRQPESWLDPAEPCGAAHAAGMRTREYTDAAEIPQLLFLRTEKLAGRQ